MKISSFIIFLFQNNPNDKYMYKEEEAGYPDTSFEFDTQKIIVLSVAALILIFLCWEAYLRLRKKPELPKVYKPIFNPYKSDISEENQERIANMPVEDKARLMYNIKKSQQKLNN